MLAVTLTMILIMPGEVPDVTVQRPYPSIVECLDAAHKWLELDPHMAGGVGLAAACAVESEKS